MAAVPAVRETGLVGLGKEESKSTGKALRLVTVMASQPRLQYFTLGLITRVGCRIIDNMRWDEGCNHV